MAMSEYMRKRFEHIMNDRPLPEKKKYRIPAKSDKRKKKEAEQKEALGGEPTEKELWFQERRLELKGVCSHCGAKSCKDSDEFFRFSICHILEKAYYPSVAFHEKNFLELCFWGENSCHSQMDNKMLDMTDMNCWDEIVVKFQAIYPSIAPSERRRIPDILRQYINTDL